jgi:hypothetical protein
MEVKVNQRAACEAEGGTCLGTQPVMWRGNWFAEDDRFNMGAYTFH